MCLLSLDICFSIVTSSLLCVPMFSEFRLVHCLACVILHLSSLYISGASMLIGPFAQWPWLEGLVSLSLREEELQVWCHCSFATDGFSIRNPKLLGLFWQENAIYWRSFSEVNFLRAKTVIFYLLLKYILFCFIYMPKYVAIKLYKIGP